jgi:ATP-dependent DNA ligase
MAQAYLARRTSSNAAREPLARRRDTLAELCPRLDGPAVRFVVGAGTALYAAAVALGQEGVVAKHGASAYRPGRRVAAWRKIKPVQRACGEGQRFEGWKG